MKFNESNLPELGQQVHINACESKSDEIGFVFGIMKRYNIGTIVYVDTLAITPDDMAQGDGQLRSVSPSFLKSI